jgi:hypothetical protein
MRDERLRLQVGRWLVVLSLGAGCGGSGVGGKSDGGGTAATGGQGGTVGAAGAAGTTTVSGAGGAAGTTGAGGAAGTTGAGGLSGAAGVAGTSGAAGASGTTGVAGAGGQTVATDLPQGNNGIAARHPGDVGIGMDADVIYADDFESYVKDADLNNNWSAVYQNQYVHITTDPAQIYRGKQALEFILPQETAELSDGTDMVLKNEQDVLFLRYYSKFRPPYDVVGSSHNGASISAHYFIGNMATPGVPANGTNKFLVNLENWRGDATTPSPGDLNVYVYYPDQRSAYGDHFYPTGLVDPNTSIPHDFGPSFVKRPDIIPQLDRWYCFEYMVKANTPGMMDGRIAIWLDGALVADFGNMRFRDVASLKIDRFGLSFHIKSNPNQEAAKWYDNVVAARSYIGPVVGP